MILKLQISQQPDIQKMIFLILLVELLVLEGHRFRVQVLMAIVVKRWIFGH